MTAFIIAVQGSVTQAVFLEFAATVSHTSVIWGWGPNRLAFRQPIRRRRRGAVFSDGTGTPDYRHRLVPAGRTRREQLRLGGAAPPRATGRIVVFGLSGGLIPCSAAIAVLVLCLQVNQIWLGVALVLCFSIGLAITPIAAGMNAAIGMHHFSHRWPGFGELAQRVPYLSGILMIRLGLYVGWQVAERPHHPAKCGITPHNRPRPPKTPPASRAHNGLSRVAIRRPTAAAVTSALCQLVSAARAIT